jgi:MFS family permease
VSNIAVLARHYNELEWLDGEHKMSRPYYRWVIVAAGGLLGCVAIGTMFSLPVFLRSISRDTGWSITGVSSAMTFGFIAMAFGSIIWGNLSDRFGPRPIVLIGSSVLATALALASRATSLIEFQLIFGFGGRWCDSGHLCAHDGLRDRLV